MDWEKIGAIGALLSFFVTLTAEWKRLRRLTLRGVLVPFVLGIAVFLVANNAPAIMTFLSGALAPILESAEQQPSTPSPAPLTMIPSPNPWQTDLTQIPETSGRVEWHLKAGQTLMLTGGQFQSRIGWVLPAY